jgi:hypothetical protein
MQAGEHLQEHIQKHYGDSPTVEQMLGNFIALTSEVVFWANVLRAADVTPEALAKYQAVGQKMGVRSFQLFVQDVATEKKVEALKDSLIT